MDEALEAAMRSVAELEEDGDEDENYFDEELCESERLTAAVNAVESGEMSYREAESAYSIGRMRIQRRVKKQVQMQARNGANPVLTAGEEAGIVESILKRTDRAQCMTTQELAAFVRKTVESSPYERLIPAKFPSLLWCNRFQERHREVFSKRKPQRFDEKRAQASTTENISEFYDELSKTFRLAPGLPSSRIWNLDETGMCGQGSHRGKTVLATKEKPANTQQSDDRTNVSALVCVNADGGHVPPFFILPGVSFGEEYMTNALPDSAFASSKSAFMTTDLFIPYIEWFVDTIPAERPVLVIMDGCTAHISWEALEHAKRNCVLVHTLPAHTSHFLQPLDSTVFLHFKRELDDEIGAFRVRNGYPATKYNMVEVASLALPRCWTRSHVVSGFEKTGIYPLSKETMLQGIIGDGPVEKAMVLLKPTLITSERTLNRLKRDGLDPDTVRVLSLNDMDMMKAQERKKPKLAKAKGFVRGGKLVTTEGFIAHLKEKAEEKKAKISRQKERQLDKERKHEDKIVQKYLTAEKEREKEQQRAEQKLTQERQQADRVRAQELKKTELKLVRERQQADRVRVQEQKIAERERVLGQKKADREHAKQLRKEERKMAAVALLLMRREDKLPVLKQRRPAAARKRGLESAKSPGCQGKKIGELPRAPLRQLDQNTVFLSEDVAFV